MHSLLVTLYVTEYCVYLLCILDPIDPCKKTLIAFLKTLTMYKRNARNNNNELSTIYQGVRRRGLVVSTVDYGVGDPQFKSRREVKKMFPQEKLLLLISSFLHRK